MATERLISQPEDMYSRKVGVLLYIRLYNISYYIIYILLYNISYYIIYIII